jgi:hypothetical protein
MANSITIESLIQRLGSSSPAVQKEALVYLARLGRNAAPAAPAIVSFLKRTQDRRLAAISFDCLGSIFAGSGTVTCPSFIVEFLRDRLTAPGSEGMRGIFCEVLGRIGPSANSALPELLGLMRTGKWHSERVPAKKAIRLISQMHARPSRIGHDPDV